MNGKCIIITSYLESNINTNIKIGIDDYIICADGGFEHALKENVIPNTVIGDFDSCSFDILKKSIYDNDHFKEIEIIRTQPEKNDTDTFMCVKYGLDKGYKEFHIIGGLGGRIDHTLANLQVLSFILDSGASAWISDGKNRVTMIQGPDTISLDCNEFDYFSIYSYTAQCKEVYEINSKYTLNNVVLTQSNPVGTSNELLDEPTVIKLTEGKLIITLSSN